MQKLLRASFLLVTLAVSVLLSGIFQTAHAQTMTPELAAANQLASAMSNLYVKDKNLIPETMSGDFTYGSLLCSKKGAEVVSCTQGDLTATCSLITIVTSEISSTSGTSCSIKNGAGQVVEVGEPGETERTFDPEVFNFAGGTIITDTTTIDPTTGESNTATTINSSGSCSAFNLAQCIANLPGMLFAGLAFLFLGLSGIVLAIAGTVFNWVIIRTVFQFGTYFGTSESMLITWGVIRDIGNIALLFGFIFVGVATILNTHSVEGFTAKKALPRLIIFAVLLNFSLFASQAVIDVANGFGSVFTTLAGQECSTTVSSTANGEPGAQDAQTNEDCTNTGISGKVLSAVGLTKIFDTTNKTGEFFQNLVDRPYTYTLMLLILSVFVTITAMVLLAGAIMLIIRVVSLSLLMVTSPIGFAGMAIPPLQGLAKDWWHRLISQAFFAPVFLLMIFIGLKLVETLSDGQATITDALLGNSASTGATTAGNMQVIMIFAIVIGFMIAALIVAQKMGAYGAKFATNSASALVYGSMTRATNLAVGGGAYKLRRLQQRTGFGGKAGEMAVNRVLRPLETTNLDMRRGPVGAILGAAGATAGKKPAEHATFGDMKHQYDDIVEGTAGKKLNAQYTKEKNLRVLEDLAHHGKLNDATPEAEEARRTLASLSTKELEELHGIKSGVAQLAENLSPEQFENLMKSDKLDGRQMGDLAKGRFAPLAAAVASGSAADVKAQIKGMSKADLERMPASELASPLVLDALSDKQRDDLGDSKKRTDAERRLVKSYSKPEKFKTAFEGAATPADKYAVVTDPAIGIRNLSAPQVAKLDSSILTNDAVMSELTPAMLIELQDNKKLSAGDITTIGNHIKSSPAMAGYSHVMGAGAAYWS